MHGVQIFELLLCPSLNDYYVCVLLRLKEAFLTQAMSGRKCPFSKGVVDFAVFWNRPGLYTKNNSMYR